MKKFVLLFALLGVVGLTANAQSGAKSCAKTCTKSAKSADATKVAEHSVASAARLAANDASIEQKVCATSGTVSYMRKNVCGKTGKVSYADVEYCTKSGKFVNVSPSGAGAGNAMTAKTVSATGAVKGKGCCAKGSKASCSKKAAKASTSAAPAAPGKLVKGEN